MPGRTLLNAPDHERWMQAALGAAREALDHDEVPVGAVVVAGGRLVATAANACVAEHDPSAHAEIRALREAGRVLGNYRMPGATLYVTLEPCIMCAGAMVNARIDRVVYGCGDPRAGAAGSVANVLQTPFLNHRCDILHGVLERPCRELLDRFFTGRR